MSRLARPNVNCVGMNGGVFLLELYSWLLFGGRGGSRTNWKNDVFHSRMLFRILNSFERVEITFFKRLNECGPYYYYFSI